MSNKLIIMDGLKNKVSKPNAKKIAAIILGVYFFIIFKKPFA